MDLIKELGEYLRDLAGEAVIRNGDYPRNKNILDVTLILSELSIVEKIKNYYATAVNFIHSTKDREESVERKLQEVEDISKDLPTLL